MSKRPKCFCSFAFSTSAAEVVVSTNSLRVPSLSAMSPTPLRWGLMPRDSVTHSQEAVKMR